MPELKITSEQLDEFDLEPPRFSFGEKDVAEAVGSEGPLECVRVKHNFQIVGQLLPTENYKVVSVISENALPRPFSR